MAAGTAVAMGVGGALLLGLALANQKKKRTEEDTPPNVDPFLFDTLDNGVKVFKPEVAAMLVRSLHGFGFREDGDTIELTPLVLGNPTAFEWAQEENEDVTILAVRWLAVPTTQPIRLLKAVEPGTEAAFASDPDGIFAVLAFPGTINDTPGLGDLPFDPQDIPPPGVLDPDVPGGIPGLGGLPGVIPGRFPIPPGGGGTIPGVPSIPGIPTAPTSPLAPRTFRVTEATGNPGDVAEWYTGDFRRWLEIPQSNPHMRIVDRNGKPTSSKASAFGISPWIGEMFTVPLDWDVSRGEPGSGLSVV